MDGLRYENNKNICKVSLLGCDDAYFGRLAAKCGVCYLETQ